jgi:hypothetical protein
MWSLLHFNKKRHALCLGVTGFITPPIGQAFVTRVSQQGFGAFCITDL